METKKEITSSIDGLKQLFHNADQDLNYVHQKLNIDFYQQYGASLNPIKMLERIKWIQDDIGNLVKDLEQIQAQKKEFVEHYAPILLANRQTIQMVQKKHNIPTPTDENDFILNRFIESVDNCKSKLSSNNNNSNNKMDYTMTTTNYPTERSVHNQMVRNSEHLQVEMQKINQLLKDNSLNNQNENTNDKDNHNNNENNKNNINVNSNSNNNQNNNSTTESTSTTQPKPIKRTKTNYHPISEKEFTGVADSIKGRCKLEDVNKIYEKVYQFYKDKANAKNIITLQQLASMGCKTLGLSGTSAILTLKSLKIIDSTKQGILLVNNK